MHYCLELILPKTNQLKEDIEKILSPFNEHDEDSKHSFFDYWVVGGRYAGSKLAAKLDNEKVDLFYEKVKSEKVMVKALVAGKQEIATYEDQVKVDQIWKAMFPESGIEVCPFFKHSNNQYDSEDTLPMDVCDVKDVPDGYTCARLIVAAPDYNNELAAKYMISTDVWNGVSWIDTKWNGDFKKGIKMFKDSIKGCKQEYQEKFNFEKFVAVTIDYHS